MSVRANENGESSEEAQIQWLNLMLILFAALVFSLIYIYVIPNQPQGFWSLLANIIPSAIVVMLTSVVLYVMFHRFGNTPDRRILHAISSLGEEIKIHRSMDEEAFSNNIVEKVVAIKENPRYPAIYHFNDKYTDVKWGDFILMAESSIDISVHYYDSWVKNNAESIKKFFMKPNTKMRVYMGDPDEPLVMGVISSLFKESSKEELKSKVIKTKDRLDQLREAAGASPGRLEVRYLKTPLTYSAVCFDGKYLGLSLFEMHREMGVGSPVFFLQLESSQNIKEFWKKELAGFERDGFEKKSTSSTQK